MEKEIIHSEELITALVDEHGDSLLSWAFYKTSKKEIAEDLVQETFIAAFKGIDHFQEKSNHKTWLFGILNNKIAEYHRNRIRKGTDNSLELKPEQFNEKGNWQEAAKPKHWEDDSHLLDNPDFKFILIDCMGRLPEQWASALNYKYLSDKKSSEICQELEISETNYWQILHRAKLKVRECLEMNWFK